MSDEIKPRDCASCGKQFTPKDFAPYATRCYPCFKASKNEPAVPSVLGTEYERGYLAGVRAAIDALKPLESLPLQ